MALILLHVGHVAFQVLRRLVSFLDLLLQPVDATLQLVSLQETLVLGDGLDAFQLILGLIELIIFVLYTAVSVFVALLLMTDSVQINSHYF